MLTVASVNHNVFDYAIGAAICQVSESSFESASPVKILYFISGNELGIDIPSYT